MSRRSKYRTKIPKASATPVVPLKTINWEHDDAVYTKLRSYLDSFGKEALLTLAAFYATFVNKAEPRLYKEAMYSMCPLSRYNRSNLEEGDQNE